MPQVSDYTALLSGTTMTGSVGEAVFISFSFPTSLPTYLEASYPKEGFRTMSPAEEANARLALAAIADACGITFFEVAPGDGDINFMVFEFDDIAQGQWAGFAQYPGGAFWGGDQFSSDVFLDEEAASNMQVLIHEIGHAVGLKHPFDGDVTLLPEYDKFEFTMMSYAWDTLGGVLGSLDDDALRHMYGDPSSDGTQIASWQWNSTSKTLTQTGDGLDESIFGIGGSDIIKGQGGADTIYGRGGNDVLEGGDGDDVLNGGSGNDQLRGGTGADQLMDFDGDNVFDGGDGSDTIFAGSGTDTVRAGAGDDFVNYDISGALTTLDMDGGLGHDNLSLSFTDQVARTISVSQLPGTGFEAFSLTMNGGADTISANTSANTYISAGGGNDTIRFGAATGAAFGDMGDDRIFAGSGFTFLYGGTGKDRFVFETTASSSQTTSVDQIEDFETGVDLIDILALKPTTVALTAIGGGGYYLQASGSGGDFTLYIRTNVSLNDVLALKLVGTANAETLRGTEARDTLSGEAGNDVLRGGGGNDILNGGAGADSLIGGAGDDTYYVGNNGDLATENAAEGHDRVISTVSYTLGANIENLAFTGTAALNGTGNDLANGITGNAGANVLNGGGGNDLIKGVSGIDTLNGGAGNDKLYGGAGDDLLSGGSGIDYFFFDTALSVTANVDRITDFNLADDTIRIDDDVFTAVGPLGTLAAGAFHRGSAAQDASDRIIHDSATGNIYYDADGNGAGAHILFAQVSAGLMLTNSDFYIVG